LTWLALQKEKLGQLKAVVIVYKTQLWNLADVYSLNQPLVDSWLHEAEKFVPDLNCVDLKKWMKLRRPNTPTDVFIVQISCIQKEGNRFQKFLTNLPFKYLIIDEAHAWVRGQQSNVSNQLKFLRNHLLPRTSAVYLLSGTPFKGKMQFDLVETLKSLAPEARRGKWLVKFLDDEGAVEESEPTACYTTPALTALSRDWENISHQRKTQMLVPLLLLRTSKTKIDGVTIMPDYEESLVAILSGEIPFKELRKEIQYRENLLSWYYAQRDKGGANRYVLGRWVSYSSSVIKRNWVTQREDPTWWDSFTLEDASEFARGACLVKLLRCWKNQGKKPIVFASAVFHQQFAGKVIPL